ncbi:predicted protein [Meyerozyma guilliermondii ATCC 6260]|uniref:Uncharacterized protein n=1 Tax=Meyerozyma guilliermondii (strain ATCC 6260 / CBS 566 / DSM 6381 / JCM 1539 / NBRC 10279 / NRRL Y-324) TaxID=294746 RepID=A5DMV9_PICGU|nr:uncharacterized protein PGUG_04610 [Meyerozyma guilliermondii ATCC 6260]EDK40512.2 predicted protein [Meyerozyma guilliermondii ATCC 6260]
MIPRGLYNARSSKLGGNLQSLMLPDGCHNVRELKWEKSVNFLRFPPYKEYKELSSEGIFAEIEPENPKLVTLGPTMVRTSSSSIAPSPIYEKCSKSLFQSTSTSEEKPKGSRSHFKDNTLRASSFGWFSFILIVQSLANNFIKLVGNVSKVTRLRITVFKSG